MGVSFVHILPLFLLYLRLCSARMLPLRSRTDHKVAERVQLASVHLWTNLDPDEQQTSTRSHSLGHGKMKQIFRWPQTRPHLEEEAIRYSDVGKRRALRVLAEATSGMINSLHEFLGPMGDKAVANSGRKTNGAQKVPIFQKLPRNTPYPYSGPNPETSDGPAPDGEHGP